MSEEKKINSNKLVSTRIHFYSCCGDKFVKVYSKQKDEHGLEIIKVTGKKSLYDMIQSDRDSSNIELLYKRYKNGDMTVKRNALNVQGQLTDFRNLPNDLISIDNFMSNIKDLFYTLPYDLRDKFNNSYSSFALQVKNGSADKIVNDYIKDVYNIAIENKSELKGVDNNGYNKSGE